MKLYGLERVYVYTRNERSVQRLDRIFKPLIRLFSIPASVGVVFTPLDDLFPEDKSKPLTSAFKRILKGILGGFSFVCFLFFGAIAAILERIYYFLWEHISMDEENRAKSKMTGVTITFV